MGLDSGAGHRLTASRISTTPIGIAAHAATQPRVAREYPANPGLGYATPLGSKTVRQHIRKVDSRSPARVSS